MNIPVVSSVKNLVQGKAKIDFRSKTARHTKTFLGNLFFNLLLLALSFVFIYPLLYMISQSLMRPTDVADATVQWIPRNFELKNYEVAFDAIHYWDGFMNSAWISLGSAIMQVISCSFIGYGFARYNFPGKGLLMGLLIFTFLVPPTTIIVPLFRFYFELGWINTFWPFIVPSSLGFGLQGALFVLICIQFYRGLPKVLEEAARIDGAGPLRTYVTIMLPLARPALIVIFLFSVVWHWNDVFEPNMFLLLPEYFNLAQYLGAFFGNANADGVAQMANAVQSSELLTAAPTLMNQIMAATMLTILPILILYLFVQRAFVEGIERTGIAGE